MHAETSRHSYGAPNIADIFMSFMDKKIISRAQRYAVAPAPWLPTSASLTTFTCSWSGLPQASDGHVQAAFERPGEADQSQGAPAPAPALGPQHPSESAKA